MSYLTLSRETASSLFLFDVVLRESAWGGAVFSRDERHRFALWRLSGFGDWAAAGRKPYAFIGLNPSTADEAFDDPTVRRCIAFAKRERAGGMYMLNLFSLRSTNPKNLLRPGIEPTLPENLVAVSYVAGISHSVVLCWGSNRVVHLRSDVVGKCLATVTPKGVLADIALHFGRNKDGCPQHPLYLPKERSLIPFSPRKPGKS